MKCSKCEQEPHPMIPCSEARALRDPKQKMVLYLISWRNPKLSKDWHFDSATVVWGYALSRVRSLRASRFKTKRLRKEVYV